VVWLITKPQLQHEGHQQDFTQQAAVFHQCGNEPGEVEACQFASQTGAAADQDQLTRPLGGEDFERFDLGDTTRQVLPCTPWLDARCLPGPRPHHQHAAPVALGQHLDLQACVAGRRI
jgi:hypothetical protein